VFAWYQAETPRQFLSLQQPAREFRNVRFAKRRNLYFQLSIAFRGSESGRKSSNSRRTPLGSMTLVMLVFVDPVRGSATVTPRCLRPETAALRFSGQMPMWLRPGVRSPGVVFDGEGFFEAHGLRVEPHRLVVVLRENSDVI